VVDSRVSSKDAGSAGGFREEQGSAVRRRRVARRKGPALLLTDVIALDIVEVSPPYDHAEITAQNANRVILEMISALAAKRRRTGPR
jgi:agmatinase